MINKLSYKNSFYLLLVFNILVFSAIIINKNNIIPLYKKVTRIYISLMQSRIYNGQNLMIPNQLLENNEKVISIKGSVGKKNKGKEIQITFVGNSISLSIPNKKIGWYGKWGMAATNYERAYPQVVSSMISNNFNYKVNYDIYNLSSIALKRNYSSNFIENVKNENPDIFIVQLGDNLSRKNINLFKQDLSSIIKKLPKFKCGIFTTPFYPDEEKNQIFLELSEKFNYYLVDLSNIIATSDKPNSKLAIDEGKFIDPGVRAHPGDLGMSLIAKQIYATAKKCLD